MRKQVSGRSLLLIVLGLGCGFGSWLCDDMEMEVCLYILFFRCIDVGFMLLPSISERHLALNVYLTIE